MKRKDQASCNQHSMTMVRRFIERNDLTARRSRQVLRVHQILLQYGETFQALLSQSSNDLLLTIPPKPFQDRRGRQYRPIEFGLHSAIALEGVTFGQWNILPDENELLKYKRILIHAGKFDFPFSLHGTYIPGCGASSDILWDWREMYQYSGDIIMGMVMVVKRALMTALQFEIIPVLNKMGLNKYGGKIDLIDFGSTNGMPKPKDKSQSSQLSDNAFHKLLSQEIEVNEQLIIRREHPTQKDCSASTKTWIGA